MMQPNFPRLLRLEYVALWLLPLLLIALAETDTIPVGFFAEKDTLIYILNLSGVILTLDFVFMAFKFFSFKAVAGMIEQTPPEERARRRFVLQTIRYVFLLLAVLFDLFAYYATLNTTGALLAGIIALTALFCLPVAVEEGVAE